MYGTKHTDKIILFLGGKKVLSIFNFYITALRGDSFVSAKVTSLLQLLLNSPKHLETRQQWVGMKNKVERGSNGTVHRFGSVCLR